LGSERERLPVGRPLWLAHVPPVEREGVRIPGGRIRDPQLGDVLVLLEVRLGDGERDPAAVGRHLGVRYAHDLSGEIEREPTLGAERRGGKAEQHEARERERQPGAHGVPPGRTGVRERTGTTGFRARR